MGLQELYLLLRRGGESRYVPHSWGILAVVRSKNNAGLFPHCEYEIAISLPLPITINQVELSTAQMKSPIPPCFQNADALLHIVGGNCLFVKRIYSHVDIFNGSCERI